MTTVLEAVRGKVDDTIGKLATAEFRVDPIAGQHLSRVTSIMSSAYKRHGGIIEIALFEAIRQQNAIDARHKQGFYISHNASSYVEGHSYRSGEGFSAVLGTNMPYQETGSLYEVDILYFDHSSSTVVALEVKRGHGEFDRGKRDSLIKAALTIRILLKNFAEVNNWPVRNIESRILAYYGVPKFPQQIYLRGADLDVFIGPGIIEAVESVNDYFRARLMALVNGDAGQGRLFGEVQSDLH